jgi:phospholipase D-like protein
MTRTKKKWSDLTAGQQKALIAGGVVEVVLTTVALRDLARRPASEVRGRKGLWALSLVVQPFGPIAYLLRGRHRT